MSELGMGLDKGPGRGFRVLVVDDEPTIRGPLGLCLETLGHEVKEAATCEEALGVAGQTALDVAMVDVRLGVASGLDLLARLLALQPRLKIIIITAYGSVDVAVRAMARGATDFLCKPFTPEQVAASVARAGALRELEADVGIAPDRSGTAGPSADFATSCAALEQAIATVRQIAPTGAPVVLCGESGTGKAVLARAIHGWSRNPDGPFASVDCRAHSPAFVELALFGDSPGTEHLGTPAWEPLVKQAAGGTLLIRGSDLLSKSAQDRLAHLAQSRGQRRSESATYSSGFRIIATTTTVESFVSGPLAMALGGVQVALPPLRERLDDIPMLAQRYLSFARQNSHSPVLGFAADAMDRMMGYSWPGNLRELHSVVEQAFAAARSAYIGAAELPDRIQKASAARRPRAGDPIPLRELEAAHIREILANQQSLQAAAEVLGLDLQALYRRRKLYGLE